MPETPEEPAAVWVPLDQLKPWEKNPRLNDHAVDRVAESIKRFGFGAPILARRADGETEGAEYGIRIVLIPGPKTGE